MERYRDVGGCWRKDNSNYIRSSIARGTSNIAFPAEKKKPQQHENRPIKEREFTALPIQELLFSIQASRRTCSQAHAYE